ncbi:hypothetical protein JR064_04755 [Xanthomonas sp. CFBP 8703]|uniref:Uncharacterized protein n=1 Tax=Xanthomonas bonasiae TaxID=2810351 RepID=A0ABS3B1I9_9XANT|nr:hypothetical protein [Xanthomonas bonasiae]MBN6101470.1 hypothetical protein [Xanthomonas bonasiae]
MSHPSPPAAAVPVATPPEPSNAGDPLLLGSVPRVALAAAVSLLLWMGYALIR